MRGPLEKRFWAKVEKRGPDECWPWTAATSEGYGLIGAGGAAAATLRAHRVAYELVKGPIPAGKSVLHRCDNPPCCNPAHLVAGDQAQNVVEMRDRRRGHGWKLTAAEVEAIRSSPLPQRDLADRFGVSQPQISRIQRGVCW